MKKMKLIGVTGPSGGGKTAVAQYYASLGYPVADGDVISREITRPGSPVLAELAAAFGRDILAEDGHLLRKKLGERAFATQQGNARLMAITHPAILNRLLQMVQEAAATNASLFFFDGAMIIGQLIEPYCDKIIVVTAPREVLLARIMERDALSRQAAETRLAAQLSQQEFRGAADYVLHNDSTMEALYRQAKNVLQELEK